jgi:hypothetical protein
MGQGGPLSVSTRIKSVRGAKNTFKYIKVHVPQIQGPVAWIGANLLREEIADGDVARAVRGMRGGEGRVHSGDCHARCRHKLQPCVLVARQQVSFDICMRHTQGPNALTHE